MTVELDLVSEASISGAFARIRSEAGDPSVLVYNAGYLEGRDLPPEMELLEHIPVEMFDTRSEEHTSELQSLMRNSYAVFCLKKKQSTSTFSNGCHTAVPTN